MSRMRQQQDPVSSDAEPAIDGELASVDELGLSVRTNNYLRGYGMATVKDLVRQRSEALLALPNIGEKTLAAIEVALRARGLRLGLRIGTAETGEDGSIAARDARLLCSASGVEPPQLALSSPLQTIEEELKRVVDVLVKRRHRKAVLVRFGWLGGQSVTLQEIASDISLSGLGQAVSRERIRQLEVQARKAIRGGTGGGRFRRVDAAARLFASSLPLAVRHVPDLLRTQGLSSNGMTYDGLAIAFDLLGISWEAGILGRGKERILVPPGRRIERGYAMMLAELHLMAKEPFANVNETRRFRRINAYLGGSAENDARTIAAKMVDAVPDFRWLDKKTGFFWHSEDPLALRHNKVVFVCRKLFSLANRLTIDEIHAALERSRTVPVVPPVAVLLEMLRQTGWFDIQDDVVACRDGVTFQDLNGQDRTMIAAFGEVPYSLRFVDLRTNLVASGMSRGQADLSIHQNPLIARVSRGVYRLLGPR